MSFKDIITDYLTIRKGTLCDTDLNVNGNLNINDVAIINDKLGIRISDPKSDLDISGHTGITLPITSTSNSINVPIGTAIYSNNSINTNNQNIESDVGVNLDSIWKKLLFEGDLEEFFTVDNNYIVPKDDTNDLSGVYIQIGGPIQRTGRGIDGYISGADGKLYSFDHYKANNFDYPKSGFTTDNFGRYNISIVANQLPDIYVIELTGGTDISKDISNNLTLISISTKPNISDPNAIINIADNITPLSTLAAKFFIKQKEDANNTDTLEESNNIIANKIGFASSDLNTDFLQVENVKIQSFVSQFNILTDNLTTISSNIDITKDTILDNIVDYIDNNVEETTLSLIDTNDISGIIHQIETSTTDSLNLSEDLKDNTISFVSGINSEISNSIADTTINSDEIMDTIIAIVESTNQYLENPNIDIVDVLSTTTISIFGFSKY